MKRLLYIIILSGLLPFNRQAQADTYPELKMNGPDPNKKYRVSEINLNTGTKSTLPENGRVFSGETLMEQRLKWYLKRARTSSIPELEAI